MLLGSGGAGDPTHFRLLARQALGAGSVEVAHAEDLDGDGLVVAVAMLGAPAITAELLFEGDEFVRALRGLERHLGRRAVAIMGLETAGVNAFPPIVVAAALGLPLLDLDGMGRGFPRLDHTVLHARGAHGGRMAGAGVAGELVVIDARDTVRAEDVIRGSLGALGGWAAAACYPMSVAEAAAWGLHGSLARALALGEAAEGAVDAEDLAGRIGATPLGSGRVIGLERATRGRPRTSAIVEPLAACDATLRLELQTEYLLATLDGHVVAATPDLIVVVGAHGLAPILCDELRRGDEVAVLRLPADDAWLEPAALALAGPAAFGYRVAEVAR
jgi:uncharacterized protein